MGGTIRNCAGGLTPWGSWITCEETFHDWNSRADGFNHGYIFDVPGFGVGTGVPIRAAGRFSHEAVAVDPRTSIVYETEDAGSSALYKYVPPGAGRHRFGRRRRGPAHNNIVLGPGDLDAINAVFPGTRDNFWDEPEGNYTDVEWAGATFYGDWLFVNIMGPRVTFAITGPWHRGAL
jgi:secreted PhoX family phosphatase